MSEPPDNDPQRRRSQPRRRVLLSGKLVYGEPPMTMDCAISDLSRGGARIRLPGPEPLAEPLYLIDVRHGLAFRAREMWRQGNRIGLSFTAYYDLRTPPPELPKIVRQLWVEQIR
jgi:hypothetical protein